MDFSMHTISDSSDDEEYEVERILKKRVVMDEKGHHKIEYLVKWRYWPINDSSWEPAEHLHNATAKIKEFLQEKARNEQQKNYAISQLFYGEPNEQCRRITEVPKNKESPESNKEERKKIMPKKSAPILISDRSGTKKDNKKVKGTPKVDSESFEPLNGDFFILGAVQPEIQLIICNQEGEKRQMSSRELRKKYPYKLIQFYESKICKSRETRQLASNEFSLDSDSQ